MLVVRALAVNSQVLEPLADTRGMPAIAIAADDQLMPVAAPGMSSDRAAHGFGGLAHCLAVFLGCGGIAQGLMLEIAAVANQLTEQDQLMVCPGVGIAERGLRQLPGQGQAVPGL